MDRGKWVTTGALITSKRNGEKVMKRKEMNQMSRRERIIFLYNWIFI